MKDETAPVRLARLVVIGTSAGGLNAMARLLDVLPPDSGMAFILVQHLEPNHESVLPELLATHTSMAVNAATDGMQIAPDHVYICPPGHFLAVRFGALQLSQSNPDHGPRLPIDFLIRSLIPDNAARTTCVILSGTGSDGSGSLAAFKQHGGTILVQAPEEAEFDGMPRSAIDTGLADAIVPIAGMPAELAKLGGLPIRPHASAGSGATIGVAGEIPAIIAELQKQTGQNFTEYKPGTLTRRIERRLGMCGFSTGDFQGYLRKLQDDKEECLQLAEDLLINVTSFFRDPEVFEVLEKNVVPKLIHDLAPDLALRVWVAGCSTGEEAYSIAMICRDAIIASGRDIKLQVFASDIDAQAIAEARDGIYPPSIKEEIPHERLSRYFIPEDDGYRVTPGLRGSVIFTVQDVLHDPPFSRIDLVSCRNLLIYLKPDAQAKVISLFHFALRERGILLLGSAETPGSGESRFKPLHKAERVYRHIGQSRPGEPGFPLSFVEAIPRLTVKEQKLQVTHQAMLAELCRDLVIENYAPASILVNDQRQCLYSLGPVSRYLRLAAVPPTHDLLAMAPPDLRAKLRYAIGRANGDNPYFRSRACQTVFEGQTIAFTIQVRFLERDGEELHMVSFVEEAVDQPGGAPTIDESGQAQIRALERELELSRADLMKAIQSRDALVLEQKAINDEALSVNEEFQSTNEELLTSKEELQSLNEELIVLNNQLQETLDRQRIASDDLQNVLNSTNVATLFLDQELRIRFFTPATRAFFNVIPGDIGRPLSDLNSLSGDDDLIADARIVLLNQTSIDREIRAKSGLWFQRRIFPYRTHDGQVEGVVITFIDISERRKTAEALDLAKREAEQSNRGKSRFLAMASHDLRQPLQSLKLVQQLLQQSIKEEKGQELVSRLDHLLEAMSGMLNSLLDINQIEAGVMEVNASTFPVSTVFDQLRHEFLPRAKAQGLDLKVLPSSVQVHSDPRLLEVMLRNLLANALKYTTKGRILMGCRHVGDLIRIEVWDTGIGIAPDQVSRIFEEFHQVANPARERDGGIGLGLSIVKHLGQLLKHDVKVRSWPGKGSVFSLELPAADPNDEAAAQGEDFSRGTDQGDHSSRAVVVIEDDRDVLDLLCRVLAGAGHVVMSAADGAEALKLVAEAAIRPEIVLTDYNLPGGMDGLEVLAAIRGQVKDEIPGIILTGDISKDALGAIDPGECLLMNKPVSSSDLLAAIGRLSPSEQPRRRTSGKREAGRQAEVVCVVADSKEIQEAIRSVLEHNGRSVRVHASAEDFLASHVPGQEKCLIIDTCLPGMSGIALIEQLRSQGDRLPAVLITGQGDVGMAVHAMRSGASDFIEKPIGRSTLIECVDRAIAAVAADGREARAQSEAAIETRRRLASLSQRQKTVLDLVLSGSPSKNIAVDLGISQRTIEKHRAEIMNKLGVRTIPDLVRLVLSTPKG